MRTKLFLSLIYSTINSIPPAPIMVTNILALFSSGFYRDKITIKFIAYFTLVSIPFIIINLSNGVILKSYIISYSGALFILSTSIYSARYASKLDLESTIKKCCLFIFSAFTVSSISLAASSSPEVLYGWYSHYYTSYTAILRYGGYMYEASHFCLIATPLLAYLITTRTKNRWLYIILLTIPILASRSIGFFIIFTTSLSLCTLFNLKSKNKARRNAIIILSIFTILISAYILNDAVQTRIDRILAFSDSSTNGRTIDSYILASTIAEKKSFYFGAGIGQIKDIGEDIIKSYYKYTDDVTTVRIPSSAAEILASFGIIGLTLKILLLAAFYKKYRIYKFEFSNLLFTFMFIYQFCGSFMLSTIEIFIFSFSIFTAKAQAETLKYETRKVCMRPSIQ